MRINIIWFLWSFWSLKRVIYDNNTEVEKTQDPTRMIERMKEEDMMGEDLRNSKFGGDSDEENVENERGVERSEEENGVVELSGFLDVVSRDEQVSDEEVSDEEVSDEEVSDEEVEDGVVESIEFLVSGADIVEELGRISSREEESDEIVCFDGDMINDDNVGEAFGCEDFGGRDDDGYGDVYDDQDDFEDDFEDDHSYDD
ncbi:hypothetical protein BTUL_0010g00800 [Botrytis tulipae]|uniref:Uncharacterized protein n=1 Tax=Botrytis tulipae TaxID=87230 RepID=A0A4Z1F3X9_9HELO|nr:hypothetical protein BTUL_0010g00800 [Botrytis tulipae]